MHVELTPEMEAIVTGQVSTGHYPSAEAVVEDALRTMRLANNSGNAIESRPSQMDWQQFFARIDAEGGLEFEIERDLRPAEEREEL